MKYDFDIIGKSKVWLGISTFLVVTSIVCISVFGLNFGIDFTGGSLIEMSISSEITAADLRGAFSDLGYDAVVQDSGEGEWLVRLQEISLEEHNVIISGIESRFEGVEELRYDSIGPVIGSELKKASVQAMLILLVLIGLYIAWAFRKVEKPVSSWKYGVLTIIAAVHDVIIPLGLFAVLGKYIGYQVDTAFIAAMLTILGYSINDTIVIFDRTRENLISNRHSDASFEAIVNRSVLQSFARSVNTSLTTLLVLVAIFLFGGETTRQFILALIVGIICGAYSSIFVASPLLVIWEKWKRRRE